MKGNKDSEIDFVGMFTTITKSNLRTHITRIRHFLLSISCRMSAKYFKVFNKYLIAREKSVKKV